MLKDRRKQWQKDCINYSWSRCGTVATERNDNNPTRLKRVNAMLEADDCPTLFTWCDDPAYLERNMTAWDKFKKEAA